MNSSNRLMLHEMIFGTFMVVTWFRLVAAGAGTTLPALVFLSFILVNILLIGWCIQNETPLKWRLRLLFYPIAMNMLFQVIGKAVPLITDWRGDSLLQSMEHSLIGANLSILVEHWITPFYTEILSFCYMLFIPYLIVSMIWYFVGSLELLKLFYLGLFTIYGLGYMGYTFLPSEGPYLAMKDSFSVPLEGGVFTRLNMMMVYYGSNRVDVFPSLHCAVSSYMLLFDRWYKPWRFRLYLVPCVGLWISTIYLRYHYLIDLVYGFALAGLALWIVKRYSQKENIHEISSDLR